MKLEQENRLEIFRTLNKTLKQIDQGLRIGPGGELVFISLSLFYRIFSIICGSQLQLHLYTPPVGHIMKEHAVVSLVSHRKQMQDVPASGSTTAEQD